MKNEFQQQHYIIICQAFLFSLFSSSRFSFSSFEVSGKGSVPLSRYQYINPVWFSNTLTHPHDKSGGFQFIQRTLDRHGTAGQDCGNGVSIVINSKFIRCVRPFSLLVWINNGGSQSQPPGSSACTHAGISGIIRCK